MVTEIVHHRQGKIYTKYIYREREVGTALDMNNDSLTAAKGRHRELRKRKIAEIDERRPSHNKPNEQVSINLLIE